jgi:hypothetical protein
MSRPMPLQRNDGTEPTLLEILFSMMPDVLAPCVACKLWVEGAQRVLLSLEECPDASYAHEPGFQARDKQETTSTKGAVHAHASERQTVVSPGLALEEPPPHACSGDESEGREEVVVKDSARSHTMGHEDPAAPNSDRVSREEIPSRELEPGAPHRRGHSLDTDYQ